MATISLTSSTGKAAGTFDIRLAIFDKDGTLIDYALMWNNLATSATDTLLEAVALQTTVASSLRDDVLRAMGLDPVTWRSDPDGPLAVGPNDRVYAAVANTLEQANVKNVTPLIENSFIPAFTAHPPATYVRAVGDIKGLFSTLRKAGTKVVVATADYRDTTVRTMRELGVADLVDDYVCADDTQHPVKHSPEALLYQGRCFGVEAENIMMVGDSIGDLRMATEARVGLSLGVLTGAATQADLKPWSTVIVNSIDDIQVSA